MQQAVNAALLISAVGITIVFLALILVSLTLMLGNRLTRPRPTAPQAEAAPTQPGVAPEIVAVLAAAAEATLGRPVQIARIRYRGAMSGSDWSLQGRRSVMGSHRTRT